MPRMPASSVLGIDPYPFSVIRACMTVSMLMIVKYAARREAECPRHQTRKSPLAHLRPYRREAVLNQPEWENAVVESRDLYRSPTPFARDGLRHPRGVMGGTRPTSYKDRR